MADIHSNGGYSAQDEELMIPRMKAYIFPNIPKTDEEIEAFDLAVQYQIEHEKSIAAAFNGQAVPEGVKSFSIGDFSMTFSDGAFAGGRLTKRTICPSAYGVLLEAGLLYRGVEGRL